MAIVNGSVQLGNKDGSWFAANPTLVLLVGQHVDLLGTGLYKLGDGVTALSALPFLGNMTTIPDGLQSGGAITVVTDDVTVAAASWLISPNIYATAVGTDFLNIALSSAGNQRYIGFYGNTSNAIVKVEGAEAAIASYPTTPVGTIVIGYVLVSDASISILPDLSGYEEKVNKVNTVVGNETDGDKYPNVPAVIAALNALTLSNVLTNGNKTGELTIESDNGKSIASILNTLSTVIFQDGAVFASIKVANINSALEFFNGANGGGFYVYASKNDISHNVLNELNAPDNTINGNFQAMATNGNFMYNIPSATGYEFSDTVAGEVNTNNTRTRVAHDALNEFVSAVNDLNAPINKIQGVADFLPMTSPVYLEGRIWYDSSDKALSVYDDITGTSIQLGQEAVVRARNNSGSTILNGSVVYISGALGQNPTVALAQANVESTSLVIGFATHDIPNNTVGKVTIAGLVKDLNTSAFTDGAALFLDPSTPGGVTAIAPASPNFAVPLGFVAHSHVSQGKIFARTEMPLATDTALGTSNRVAPSQGAVKAAINALSAIYQTIITSVSWGSFINSLTSKTTPVDADQVVLMDSADTNKSKKLSWANIKATAKTYFDTLYLQITGTSLGSYLEIPEQSAPSAPTNAIRLFTDTSNRFSWKGENGFVRTFDGTANTADRMYTLPNTSGTVSLGKIFTQFSTFNPSSATTYYFGDHPGSPITATTNQKITTDQAYNIKKAIINTRVNNNASSENITISIFNGSTFDVITSAFQVSGGTGDKNLTVTGLNINIAAGVNTYIKIDFPTMVTPPTSFLGTVKLYE